MQYMCDHVMQHLDAGRVRHLLWMQMCDHVMQDLDAGRVGHLLWMHIDSKMLSKRIPAAKTSIIHTPL